MLAAVVQAGYESRYLGTSKAVGFLCSDKEHSDQVTDCHSAWSAFCDIALAVYPLYIFWGVQAFPITTKINLCVLMGFGIM